MPTYAYECAACAHRLEEFQSMSAAPLKKCPACKKQKLQRLIGSGAGVIFKGSGFYQTDYKNAGGGDKKGKGGDSKDAPAKSDGEAAKSTDKPTNAGGKANESSDAKSGSEANTNQTPNKKPPDKK